ncbi:MAG: hypothetical protein M1818_006800 [Claussenomyces sp. TS43310]|nr:MAG: hypothetical protein M1818_006800 [Claussenomyces sp. TS43310]
MALQTGAAQENSDAPTTKRLRWATQKVKGNRGASKRASILGRLHKGSSEKKRESAGGESVRTDLGVIPEAQEGTTDDAVDGKGPRTIYFNTPLPPEALDENGHPAVQYERNKIRTAKYTPLSFVPKDLFFQFQNIANNYFLLTIVLAFFPMFGVSNPGLNAVPLIVIVVLTAVKDAIEDTRRTILDSELNNSPVHRLVGWTNVNVSSDSISLWRRIKKATSRALVSVLRLVFRIGNKSKDNGEKGKSYADRAMDRQRPSLETHRQSVYSQRSSFNSARENIQMTPVASPFPRQNDTEFLDVSKTAKPYVAPTREPADLIDRTMAASGNARFHQDYWKSIQVGDFVRIYNDDQVPADVIILSTSDPDGACYVETKNLDGETNLKLRQSLRCGRSIKHARDCERTEFRIESEAPQPHLYQYSGAVRWNQKSSNNGAAQEMVEPISINNILLRGCNLRNTEWALGVVLFTGVDTKLMINQGITPSKRARIARELNWNVIYNFVILFAMCLVAGIVEGVTFGKRNTSIVFYEFGSIGKSGALNGFITFWAALILFQNLVPISLYISLEIIRTAQAYFIYSDVDMYYEKLDYPCTPKTWNISDDLGQIEYIFSDKTGTLTQNVMEFKKATINGIPYGEAYTEAQAGMQKRQGIDVEKEGAKARQEIAEARAKHLRETRKLHDNPYLHDDELTFIAPDYVMDLSGESGLEQQQANEQFMLAIALCHTVISEVTPGDPPRIEFKAQSPDEAALVATARDVGFTVLGSTPHGLRLNIMGHDREYTVLNTLEFNSTRKRMSAIIRMPDGKIVLFCKGADSIIYSRLKKGEQAELRRTTAEHLEMFAREGLRTLCIAQRVLDEEEYQNWNREHEVAAAAIHEREDKLEVVSDMIEQDLMLLGGTAIEDRLQEGVPDTIALLADAGIKLWVLTGDKVETAINIGFSCNLLNNDMELLLFRIEDNQLSTAEAQLDEHLQKFNLTGSEKDLKAAKQNHEPPAPTHALVIDGDSLKLVLDDTLRQKFLLLCKQCKSVLCCRVSPAQKAAVVDMVKNGLEVMTLAIGDGANDVAMIQKADVGVGIAGEEGRQAVMSSDYAIGQFRYLQRLILVHGRWSYRRLGETIANFFYKNIVWTLGIFWYQIFCNFDMTYLYEYTYLLLYNLAFTSVPVVFMGVLDQDVSDKVSLAVPQLYRRGIERKEWTQKKFWLYMLDGFYQSVITFFVAWLVFRTANATTGSGQDIGDRERFGVYVGCAAVFVNNMYILMNCYRWDWLLVLLTTISILLIWFWTGVYSSFASSTIFYKAAPEVFGQASYWAVTCLSIILCLLPRFTIKSLQKIYFPYDVDIIREQVRQGKYNYLDDVDGNDAARSEDSSTTSSANPKSSKHNPVYNDEDQRPIYPPSVAPTATSRNPRSHYGSDGTEYTRHRLSMEQPFEPPSRPSMDAPRPSFDRMRASMDRTRPSFEASYDFTSASLLTRLESSHSFSPTNTKMQDVSSALQ